MKRKVIIMGAAGRDFHNFNVYFRNNEKYEVRAFTATQIPDIDSRFYPPELSGKYYPDGIPIYSEEKLEGLIKDLEIDDVVFAYSDVSHNYVMHKAALVNANGANFILLGAKDTMLKSKKPLIAVTAVRTGCGKSQTSRAVCSMLKRKGFKVTVIRHPMPYGDLVSQRCQRFETISDLEKHKCTIEEREEYEYHIQRGHILYAGVDYEEILRAAEAESDIILWDGGNNDLPFYKPDLHIVLADPHRPGHEESYYPGETNFRMAEVIIIPKIGTAKAENIAKVEAAAKRLNPKATIIKADSVVKVSEPEKIKGKKVLVIEDGPTLTHGEMKYGAGVIAAKEAQAAELVDPKPYAVGTILNTFKKYPHIENLLPAMGYGQRQLKDLEKTINAVPCDLVVVGTPIDLGALLQNCVHPLHRVTYELDDNSANELNNILENFIKNFVR